MNRIISLAILLFFMLPAKARSCELPSLSGEKEDESIIATQDEEQEFSDLNNSEMKLVFSDDCTSDWQKKWSLDGMVGYVENSPEGMALHAGPEYKNDAHHVVLWTKQGFTGDLKIEYDYTRLDERDRQVNIIYIQATGFEEGEFSKDIFEWSAFREVPAMRTYYNYMHTLHISYAAFNEQGDYIRARRYRPELHNKKENTELGAAYNTGFFAQGVKHHIVLIKKGFDLYMQVSNDEQTVLYKWDYAHHPLINEGPVGLRQMFMRSSLYSNFKVWEMPAK